MTIQSIEKTAFSAKARAARRRCLQKRPKTGANQAEAMEFGGDQVFCRPAFSTQSSVIRESAPR
jgi:hypothetical protein